MENSRKLTITTANNRLSKQWISTDITWSSFVEKLSKPIITNETLDEFLSYAKAKQDELKDVGGFVGGKIKGNLRRNTAIESRCLVTLDMDNLAHGDDVEVIKKLNSFNCSFVVYSTRKHQTTKPRIRVIIPLANDVEAEEYEPIARKVAEFIGIRYCDPTTFQASRLMYWPSHSIDSNYVYKYADKPLLDGKAVLGMYQDWKNISLWPEVPGATKLHSGLLKKQGNPLEKDGIVGAFCRRYNIYEAIETFLPGEYLPCDVADRLTFSGGSTTAGAVVYEDELFLYSHHATDPCSQTLVNAFDLVRLHKFGHLDSTVDEKTPVNRLPSWTAMVKFITEKTAVQKDILNARIEKAVQEFSTAPAIVADEPALEGEVVDDSDDWMSDLVYTKEGERVAAISSNIMLILRNDKRLKGKIFIDEFSSKMLARKGLPWDKDFDGEDRLWTDTDDAGLRWYLESSYGLASVNKVHDGVCLIAEENKENKLAMRLQLTQWDGVKRLETLFIDYLGCEDNIYTREISEKSMVAAVRRAIIGGIKWDYMPIFIGPQGMGKSTFLRVLGMEWYNDSLTNLEGKEASENIQGSWIIELGELSGLRKAEINQVKNFLSRVEDVFRAAYARRTNKYPRRCVFFGTANDSNFLKDETGNRRFWPIDCFINTPNKSIFDDLADEVGQIWAEACELAKNKYYSLKFSEEVEAIAKQMQEDHSEIDIHKGLIEEYLDKLIPVNWKNYDLGMRRNFLENYDDEIKKEGVELVIRDKVCVPEIWEEALGGYIKFIKRTDSNLIFKIMSNLKKWEQIKSTSRFGKYGVQKGFKRKN